MTTTVASLGPMTTQAVSSNKIRKVGSKINKKKNNILVSTKEYVLVEYYNNDTDMEVVRIKENGEFIRISESIKKIKDSSDELVNSARVKKLIDMDTVM